jgi:hypothetical protein
MNEDYLRGRIDDILRQRIALQGGCGECDMYGSNIGYGTTVGGFGATSWNKFLRAYMRKTGLPLAEAAGPASREYKRKYGGVLVGGAKGYARYGNKTCTRRKAKTGKWGVNKYDECVPYDQVTSSRRVKRTVRRTSKRAAPRRTRKLTAKQQARIGKRYLTRVERGPRQGACFKEEPLGPWYLNQQYECLPYESSRRSRSRRLKKKR